VRQRLAAVLALVVLLPSCRTWTVGPAAVPPHESLDAVLWMRTSAEYYALAEQAYRLAMVQLDEALKPENPAWTAAFEQVAGYEDLPPAVLVDVDEAVVDTGAFQAQLVKTGEQFRPADWNRWVRELKSKAVPGAAEFARYAVARDVRLFFVTNRDHELEEATLQNLRDLGFPVDADGANVLTKGEREGWKFDKTSRRQFIAASHRIVLIIGDDLNDFVPGSLTDPRGRVALARRWRSYWGTRWIMIPNAFYGGWQRTLYGFDEGLTRQQVLRRKYDVLEALDEPPAMQTPGLPGPR
jgi:5'-nucleotidase (lipoprotein e(P4) family)